MKEHHISVECPKCGMSFIESVPTEEYVAGTAKAECLCGNVWNIDRRPHKVLGND